MVNIRMEIFDWQVVPISGKVEWKYTSLEHGALLLTLIGPVMMHKLSVASWDILNQVYINVFYCAFECVLVSNSTIFCTVFMKVSIITIYM